MLANIDKGIRMVGARRLRAGAYKLVAEDVSSNRLVSVPRFTIVLILLNVSAVVLESIASIADQYQRAFNIFELFSLLYFSAEYALRIWTAPERPFYLKDHARQSRIQYLFSAEGLIDFIAVAPFWIAAGTSIDVRTVSALRIIRLLKLGRHSPAVQSLVDVLVEERRALAGCVLILGAATLIFATGMYVIERAAQPDKLGTIPDAMWWAIVTLGTIGYGDVVPVTVAGKLLAAIAVFAGLVIVALPIGIVASAFSDAIHRRDFVVTWSMLARVPLFANLKAAEIADIVKLLRAQKVDAGALIARRGQPATSMYLVAEGEVSIELPAQPDPIVVSAGHFFGEIAVLRRAKRSATIKAVTNVKLLALDAHDLHDLMSRNQSIAHEIHRAARSRSGMALEGKSGDLTVEEIADLKSGSD
jgi:voltage-gated potassium channel